MTGSPFRCSFVKMEEREKLVSDDRPAGAFGVLAADAQLLYFCERGLQCWCVWPVCVSEDKTWGSAERKMAGHIWSPWKRAVKKVISRVLQQRPVEWDRVKEWRTALGKPEHPSREKQSNGTHETRAFNLGTNNQRGARVVTKSIIYFKTLDLRFLGY